MEGFVDGRPVMVDLPHAENWGVLRYRLWIAGVEHYSVAFGGGVETVRADRVRMVGPR